MKIRTGFVSNSSGSSFVLVYLPDNFDFETTREANLDKIKNKKSHYELEEINLVTESDIKNLIKYGVCLQNDGDDKFWPLYTFLNDYVMFVEHEVCHEGGGVLKLMDKTLMNKMTTINNKCNEDILKYKEQVIHKKKRKEEMKDKMKHIDPYGEEEWEDDGLDMKESYKIKRLK